MNLKYLWIIVVITLLVVSVLFIINQGKESILGGDDDTEMFDGMSCNIPNDCYDSLLKEGFPKSDLDLQLQNAELICVSNICGVKLK